MSARPCARSVAVALLVLLVAGPSLAAPGVTIGTNFMANSIGDTSGSYLIPPDTDGSVGLNQYVAFTNGTFSIWNKSDGSLVSKITDSTFWSNAGITSGIQNNLSDTRIIFDPASQRWFAAEITTGQTTGNYMLVARSNDADPTHGFKAASLLISPAAGANPAYFGDFTTLGISSSAVFVGVNNFDNSGNFANSINIASIPKADLLQSTPTTANKTLFTDRSSGSYGVTPQFAINLDGSINGRGVAVTDNGAGQLKLFNIDNTTAGAGAATLTNLINKTDLAAADPALMHQPDGSRNIDGGDTRFSGNAFQVGDYVYAVRNYLNTATDHDAIAWSIFRDSDKSTMAQGTIGDATHDYSYPSIAANPYGDVVIGYTRSGGTAPDGYLGAYASTGVFDGSTINFNSPLLLRQGDGIYNIRSSDGSYRWGDFSATGVDPNNPYSFWTTQEFAKSNVGGFSVGWATEVTQITFAPEPGTLAMLAVCPVALALVLIRRTRIGKP